jgi:hypothetical protein
LPLIEKVKRKISFTKSERESTDDPDLEEIKVEEKFLLDKKYKTEVCKNFMRTGEC